MYRHGRVESRAADAQIGIRRCDASVPVANPLETRQVHYDVAIVGGGHNGLVAAAYLAAAGRSCLVLERRGELGGAAVSERPFAGVDADLSRYAYLVSLLPARIIDELSLPLRLRTRTVSSYTPDPRDPRRGLLVDSSDPAATRDSFRDLTGSGAEHDAWTHFYARTARIARAVFPTLLEPLRSRAELRALIDDDAAWEAIFERPIGEVLASTFADDLIAGVVLTDALIGTFAAADEGTLVQNRCFLYHVIGAGTGEWRVPEGGMGAVSRALADAALAAGAELRTNADVLALSPDADGVDVRFGDGQREGAVRAGRVLVNAAPVELERLLGQPPSSMPEGSQLKVNLLLSRLPRLRHAGLAPERALAGTFHVNETAGQLQRAHQEASSGSIPSPVPCESYCHSLTDPSILGPELRASGVHTLTVFALHMPARVFAGDPTATREAALKATLSSLDSVLAEPIADCVLRAPDGAPCLEVRSPLDIERELRMPGGHIFHRDLAWPFAEHERDVGRWGVETDHPRVLICGAGARRGGGVSGIPGRNAAMAVLGDRSV
jgi:phytoene dehydrogenase-like protein